MSIHTPNHEVIMKIPHYAYDVMFTALNHYEYETELSFPEDPENNKKEVRHLNKKLKNIEKAHLWLRKNKKQKK